jgi:predicted NAD/FAD-binding protein
MTNWFKTLGVESEESDMSLSVSLDDGEKVEWSSDGISGLLAKKTNIVRPSFYKFLLDMKRFNSEAADLLSLSVDDPRRQLTVKQYLRNEGYSEAFASNYLIPMTAALWSASIDDVMDYPADQLISFMCNHKMLSIFDRPQVSFFVGILNFIHF